MKPEWYNREMDKARAARLARLQEEREFEELVAWVFEELYKAELREDQSQS